MRSNTLATWLEFDALDVWLFRDGRPFTAGQGHHARSVFPPPPGTMLGAARAVLLDAFFKARRGTNPEPRVDDYGNWLRHGKPGNSRRKETLDLYQKAEDDFGTGTKTKTKVSIQGPFVVSFIPPDNPHAVRKQVLFFPAPRDLATFSQKTRDACHLAFNPLREPIDGLKVSGMDSSLSWRPRSLQLPPVDDDEPEEVRWVTLNQLTGYLDGPTNSKTNSKAKSVRDPFGFEPRTGLALTPERTAREGYFYRADFVRPHAEQWSQVNAGEAARRTILLAEVPDVAGPDNQWWISLGGEGRLARVRRAPDTNLLTPAQLLSDLLNPNGAKTDRVRSKAKAEPSCWLRLLLLQPAVFSDGWLPDNVQPAEAGTVDGATEANLVLSVDDHQFALRGAMVGKPHVVSGWDLAARAPKPLARAVPAGSVYYFEYAGSPETREAAVDAFIAAYHGQYVPQKNEDYRQAGYGLAVVGVCDPVTARIAE